MKTLSFTALSAALFAIGISAAHAEPVGTHVNGSKSGRHISLNNVDSKGKALASINVHDANASSKTANNKDTSFQKIAGMADRFYTSGVVNKDNNGVVVAKMYKMKGGAWDWIPFMPDHSGLGRMSFAQAGDQDVWFGEWADVAPGAADGTAGTNRSVYYAGTNPTTNLPTSGTAVYDVKGINNHTALNTEALKGQLTADFSNNTLQGNLARTGMNLGINATITAKNATFDGKAIANGVHGVTNGQFFGNQGAALAGIATFNDNKSLNTAFGGTKR